MLYRALKATGEQITHTAPAVKVQTSLSYLLRRNLSSEQLKKHLCFPQVSFEVDLILFQSQMAFIG